MKLRKYDGFKISILIKRKVLVNILNNPSKDLITSFMKKKEN